MNVIVFASRKGGSGKSTLAAHLSAHANRPSRPCLLIDTDPQGSLTLWQQLRGTGEPKLKTASRDITNIIFGNEIFAARTRGVGVLSPELAEAYGVSGPIARASGLDFDLRRDEPYLGYDELFAPDGPGRVVTRTAGDSYARFHVLHDQVLVSLDLADACIERLRSLPPGPVSVRTPKVLKAPEGHTYCWTENPLGLNGYFLVSRGDKTPWRLKLRTASFNNIAVLPELVPGCVVADLIAVLGSMFFVVGDIDK
jgi:NADH-quinone oxidoreductase subunit D